MDSTLAQLQRLLARSISGMTPDQLTRHPEGKWSTAEILEHLNLTYVGTMKGLQRGRKRWQRLIVTGIGYFPRGRKSPERVQPRGAPAQQVTAEILENVVRMDAVLQECETRFGRSKPI